MAKLHLKNKINTKNIPENVESIILENITDIPECAFFNCRNLKNIEFINCDIKTIGKKAFKNCYNLSSFHFSENIEKIEDQAFENCINLNLDNFPICEYGTSVFQNTYLGKKITIPNIDFIPEKMFKDCKFVEEIQFLKNTKTVNEQAFKNCKNLKKVTWNDIEVIKREAFAYCHILNLTIDYPMKKIEHFAFSDMDDIKKLEIKINIKLDKAFVNTCPSELYICDAVKKIPMFFCELNSAKSIRIPEKLTFLGSHFYSHTKLPEIVFPVTQTVEEFMFFYSKATKITIPEGVKEIKDNAFNQCKKLKELYLPSTLKKMGKNCFLSCNEDIEVFFNGSEEKFKSLFKNAEDIPKNVNYFSVDDFLNKGKTFKEINKLFLEK